MRDDPLDDMTASLEYFSDDAQIGRQWREDSSLEKWFPLTAEMISKLVSEAATLRRDFAEIKAVLSDKDALRLHIFRNFSAADIDHLIGLEAQQVRAELESTKQQLAEAKRLLEAAGTTQTDDADWYRAVQKFLNQ